MRFSAINGTPQGAEVPPAMTCLRAGLSRGLDEKRSVCKQAQQLDGKVNLWTSVGMFHVCV